MSIYQLKKGLIERPPGLKKRLQLIRGRLSRIHHFNIVLRFGKRELTDIKLPGIVLGFIIID